MQAVEEKRSRRRETARGDTETLPLSAAETVNHVGL